MDLVERQTVSQSTALRGRTAASTGGFSRVLAQVAALISICTATYCAAEMAAAVYHAQVERAMWISLYGLGFLYSALMLARLPQPPFPVYSKTDAAQETQRSNRLRRTKRAALGAAVVGIVILIYDNALLVPARGAGMSHHVQAVVFLASCAVLVWGFSDRPCRVPRWANVSLADRRELAFVAGVTLFALAMRLHDLEAIRAFVDELNFIVPIRRFSHESSIQLLQPMSSIAAFPEVYPYLQSIVVAAADSALVGMRLPSALFGALTIPALYLLGKQLFDRRTAAAGAILLATYPVHLQWSRLGLNNVADPLFGVLSLALMIRGVRRGGSWHFALGGICLGLTQYFYEAGRLVFPAVTGFWFMYVMLFIVRRQQPRRFAVIFFACALLIAAPIYTTLIAMERPIIARYEMTRREEASWQNSDLAALLRQYPTELNDTLLLFVNEEERILYYAGDYPYIHVYLLPAFILGLAIVVWRWRTPGGSALILWVGGTIVAVTLLINGTTSARIVLIFPAIMLICAIGIVEPLRLLFGRHERAQRFAVVLAVGVLGLLHTAYYFGVHIDRFNRQHYAAHPEQEVAFALRDAPAGTTVHFLSSLPPRNGDLDMMAKTLNPGVMVWVPPVEERQLDYVAHVPFVRNQLFVIADDDLVTLAELKQRFVLKGPDRWENRYSPPGMFFVAYTVVADRVPPDRAP